MNRFQLLDKITESLKTDPDIFQVSRIEDEVTTVGVETKDGSMFFVEVSE